MKLLPLVIKLRAYILALRNESTVVIGTPLTRRGKYLRVRPIKVATLCCHRLSLEVA